MRRAASASTPAFKKRSSSRMAVLLSRLASGPLPMPSHSRIYKSPASVRNQAPASPLTVSPSFCRAATPATAIRGSAWVNTTLSSAPPPVYSGSRRGRPSRAERALRSLGSVRADRSGPSSSARRCPASS